MSDLDAAFMEVLESCRGAEGEVDYSDDGWKPDDGEYTVLLEKFTVGTSEKDGVVNGTAKVIFRIVTGDFASRTFGEFFWLPSNPKTTTPGQSNMLRLAKCICDRELAVAETPEAAQIIADAAGSTFLNIKVFTQTSKKNGKDYTNTRFLGLIDEPVTAEEAEAEPVEA